MRLCGARFSEDRTIDCVATVKLGEGNWKDGVELEVPAGNEYLAATREVLVAAVSATAQVSTERLENLRFAVSEAVANSIAAVSANGSRKPIRLVCAPGPGRVEVRIIDQGGGFDLGSIKQVPPPEDPLRTHFESGLGLSLMRSMVDEHSIRPSAEGTEVRLVVYTAPD